MQDECNQRPALYPGYDDLLSLGEVEGVRIISPALFARLLAERGMA